jgi:hypothetical protein
MANEDTFLPGQLPSFESLYGDEGKFAPDPTFEDRKRAEAEAQGLRFSGDVGIGPKFLEFIKNVPDAGYEFFARGFEGLGELAVGTALAGYKGGKLLLEPDPEKRREIMSEPAFTKYMGEFRGKLGSLDLAENTISGITPEQIANVLGYYVGPPSSVLAGIVRAPAMISKATKAAGQVGDELATTARFFPDYNPLRKFQPKSVGAKAVDEGSKTQKKPEGVTSIKEMIDDKTLKTADKLTTDPLNLMSIRLDRQDKFRETFKNKMIQQTKTQLNTKGVKQILEDMRTGKISQANGIDQLNEILPGQAMGKGIKSGRGFTRLQEYYNTTRTKKKNDIFDMVIEGKDGKIITPQKKKQIVDAINAAEKSKSKESFGIKFRNEYHKITKGEDQPITKLQSVDRESIIAVLKAMNKEQKIKEFDIKGISQISEDGTYYVQKEPKTFSAEAWNKVDVGEIIPSGEATKKLKLTIVSEGSEKSFGKVKSEIFGNEVIASKIKRLDELFDDLGGEHVYSLDHIRPKLFGGTDNTDNLRFIVEGPHNSGKRLDPDATFIGDTTVANKSAFEADIYSKAKEITELVKKGDLEKAREISEQINKLQNNFKNTYDNIDFIIGEAYVPIKTGDTTAKYIKYSEYLKLTPAQQKQVSELIPTYENLPNQGVSIEESLDKVIDVYRDAAQDFPSGKIERDFISQIAPEGKREGGMMSIFDMIQPINAQR